MRERKFHTVLPFISESLFGKETPKEQSLVRLHSNTFTMRKSNFIYQECFETCVYKFSAPWARSRSAFLGAKRRGPPHSRRPPGTKHPARLVLLANTRAIEREEKRCWPRFGQRAAIFCPKTISPTRFPQPSEQAKSCRRARS